MEKVKEDIVDYICLLSNSLARTTDANDRPRCKNPLAETACCLIIDEDISVANVMAGVDWNFTEASNKLK